MHAGSGRGNYQGVVTSKLLPKHKGSGSHKVRVARIKLSMLRNKDMKKESLVKTTILGILTLTQQELLSSWF